MLAEKTAIILGEGTPVEIYNWKGDLLYKTKALIGKATEQSTSEFSIENHRRGVFVSSVEVKNGHIVKLTTTDEYYLVLATYRESFQNFHLSNIARLVRCNGDVMIDVIVEDADEFGNIFTGRKIIVENLKVYTELRGGGIESYKPGIRSIVTHDVYMPMIDLPEKSGLDVLDQISIKMNGEYNVYKVEFVDYLSYDGIMVVRVSTETRGVQ